MERHLYIGGGDCAAILGLSKWRTPLDVWCAKTEHIKKEDISDKEAVSLGIELEDYVAKRFERKTGLKVRRCNKLITHKDYNFVGGHIDRDIVGEDAILECKTTSAWRAKDWEGEEIPADYIMQCYHYLMITGVSRCYLAVLIGNQDFKIKVIERDEQLQLDILKKEVEFWNKFVVPKIMPAVSYSDSETLSKLFPNAQKGTEIQLDDKASRLLDSIEALSSDLKVIENEIEKNKNELKAMIKENEIGIAQNHKISWQNREAVRIDSEKFKTEYPEVYSKCSKPSTNRFFTIRKINKKEQENG